MELKRLHVVQHRAIPPDEAWIIRRSDAAELPPDLRGKISVPCIVTGSMNMLKETLALLHLLAKDAPASGFDFMAGSCRESRRRLRQTRRRVRTIG
jgi:hypothetical protein